MQLYLICKGQIQQFILGIGIELRLAGFKGKCATSIPSLKTTVSGKSTSLKVFTFCDVIQMAFVDQNQEGFDCLEEIKLIFRYGSGNTYRTLVAASINGAESIYFCQLFSLCLVEKMTRLRKHFESTS